MFRTGAMVFAVLTVYVQVAQADTPVCMSERVHHTVQLVPESESGTVRPARMKQVSDSPGGSELSYYDIPFWSAAVDRMISNMVDADGRSWDVVSSDVRGKHSVIIARRVAPTMSAARVDVSADGRLITYTKVNPDGNSWDVYAIDVLGDGCEHRVTREHYSIPTHRADLIKTSPAVFDASANKYLIAFANVEQLYLVYQDGTAPLESTGPYSVPLQDVHHDSSFHRVRLNPVFPNLLLFRRDCRGQQGCSSHGGADPQMYVTDWTVNPPDPLTYLWYERDDKGGGHEQWTPNGRKIGAVNGPPEDPVTGSWVEYSIADSNGRLHDNLTPETVRYRIIGPFGEGSANGTVFYSSYSPDGRVLAVATTATSDAQNGCVPGKIFLMNRRSGNVLPLANTFTNDKTLFGAPKLGFYDASQVGFSSDTSCLDGNLASQIYLISRNANLP